MKSFPVYRQYDYMDCGATCLRMIARYYGQTYSLESLRNITHTGKQGVNLLNLSQAAEKIGFMAKPVKAGWDVLQEYENLPCIVHWKNNHYIVVYRVTKRFAYVADPALGRIRYSRDEFLQGWQGEGNDGGFCILLERGTSFHAIDDEQSPTSGWRYIGTLVQPYRRYLWQLFLSIIVILLVQFFLPFLAQNLIDEGVRNDNIHFVYIILLAQFILFISQSFSEVVRNYLLLYMGNRISIKLLSNFLQKLMYLPHAYFEKKNLGDLFQRISDNQRVEEFLTSQSLQAVFSLISIVVFSVVLGIYNLTVLFIFLTGSVLYLLWILLLSRRRARYEYRRFTAAASHHAQLHDLLYGMPEIRLNGSHQRRRKKWESKKLKQHQISIASMSVEQLQHKGGSFIHELKNIIITFVAAMMVIQGNMTLGMMVAVQYILGQLNAPLLGLISFVQSAQDARLSLARMMEIQAKQNPASDEGDEFKLSGSNQLQGNIRFAGVSFHYEGPSSPAVLQNIHLDIPYGKVTAIVGASGSGKTTLLKLMLKFYVPSSGQILINEKQFCKISQQSWLAQCGVVMQDGYIFDDTILANITESDSQTPLDQGRLFHAVQIACLQDFIDTLPNGYLTPVGQNGMGLSGGQKQRILIARAVYKNPAFLFFDEATSALDAENERYIVNNLENFYQGRTVIIIAHRLSTVKHADHIVVLDQGSVVEQGNHTQLTLMKGKYFSLVKNQLELGA